MRRHAAAFVRRATARRRLPLDYSVASLRLVDSLVEGLRKGGTDRVDDHIKDGTDHGHAAGTLFELGAYVGEVLVRRAGAVWVDFDAHQQRYFAQRVGVRMPDGRVWNPLGRVVSRYESGAEASLQTFYLTLHGRARART